MTDLFNSGRPWESPETCARNRLSMKSPLFPFPTAAGALEDALGGPRKRLPGGAPDSEYVVCLDGIWTFRLVDTPEAVPVDFDSPMIDDSTWSRIRVPGTWTLQGFDRPHYTNVIMPFGNVPPSAPGKNPTGLFRTRFALPEGWKNRRTVLRVGSAESFLSVSLNGQPVGYSKDSRLPAEFDLTPFLSAGENLLALKVIRYSDASYVEDQDQWWFGGIHRSVILYSTGPARIEDVDARTGRTDDTGVWHLDAVVKLGFTFDPAENIPEGSAPADYGSGAGFPGGNTSGPYYGEYRVRLNLLDPSGAAVPGSPVETAVDPYYRKSRWEAQFSLPVAAPFLWSHESPSLYTLLITLLGPGGRELEHTACRVGFRTVEVKDRALLINGKRVLIKGANRHEHDERTGKTLSTEDMIRDIEILKRHNFNAVRTSHYPNDERWYDLCDEYGIYLVDEANIEAHAYYDHLCRDPRWAQAFLDRGMRMVLRDKNHPSVILWSLGNESGYGPNHDLLAGWIRRFDPTRPLHYEGAVRPEWGQGMYTQDSVKRGRMVTDIVAPMYPPISFLEEWVRTTEDDRPFIMAEFSHAMGNSNGSLADYWNLIESGRGLQGGFIWEWCDHGIHVGEGGADAPSSTVPPGPAAGAGIRPWRYGGDFGDTPSDLDFVVDGLVFPDRSLKPVMSECARLFQPVRAVSDHPETGKILIENRFDFSSLAGLELSWNIVSGDPADGGIIARGAQPLPPLAPGELSEISIGFPHDTVFLDRFSAFECFLNIEFRLTKAVPWAGAGHRVAWEQFALRRKEQSLRETRPGTGPGAAPGTVFSREGFLSSLTVASGTREPGIEILSAPLVPSLFRVPTQNDGLKTFMGLRGKPDFTFYYTNKAMYGWLDAGLSDLRFELLESSGSGVSFRSRHRIISSRGVDIGIFEQSWSPAGAGVRGDFLFDLDTALPELPRIGVSARLEPGWDSVRWFGHGPQECYPDRQTGVAVGIWEAKIADLYVPYILPQENGNRTGLRWLELVYNRPQGGKQETGDTPSGSPGRHGVRIEADGQMSFSLSPYTETELMTALHADELPAPSEAARRGAVLHLDCEVRGVGTATCGPDTLERYRVRPGLYTMSITLRDCSKP